MAQSKQCISVVLSEAFEWPRAAWELESRQKLLEEQVLSDVLQVPQLLHDASELLELCVFLKELICVLILNYLLNFLHGLIDQCT